MNIDLLIIDPQNDFCLENGALSVGGAKEDMNRLSKMIQRIGHKLNKIHVSLDFHHFIDIAHPTFLINSEGKHPDIYSIITRTDVVERGIWRSRNPSHQHWLELYVSALENNGKYPLCVWPPHCLIGSLGAAVVQPLYDTLVDWEESNFKTVNYIIKGSNPLTEHYSAVQADVPDPDDLSTHLNISLIDELQVSDEILLAGEARSHCLASTVLDIANNMWEKNIKTMVLLEDATSDVGTFEHMGKAFVKEMTSRGMRIDTTENYLK